jgi:hypothetical protein
MAVLLPGWIRAVLYDHHLELTESPTTKARLSYMLAHCDGSDAGTSGSVYASTITQSTQSDARSDGCT